MCLTCLLPVPNLLKCFPGNLDPDFQTLQSETARIHFLADIDPLLNHSVSYHADDSSPSRVRRARGEGRNRTPALLHCDRERHVCTHGDCQQTALCAVLQPEAVWSLLRRARSLCLSGSSNATWRRLG